MSLLDCYPDCNNNQLKTNFSSSLIRYIYGFDFEFDLELLYETFVAGDKYLVHSFTDAVLEYAKNKLDVSNCVLVYDQLLKFPHQTPLLQQAAELIQKHSKKAFKCACLARIDKATLISMLSLPKLSMEEIEILKFCSDWVDVQLKQNGLFASKENRLQIFEPIRYFIRFNEIPRSAIAKFAEIESLLPADDIKQLASGHKTKTLSFKCLIKRKVFAVKQQKAKKEEVSIQIDAIGPNLNQQNHHESSQDGSFWEDLFAVIFLWTLMMVVIRVLFHLIDPEAAAALFHF